MTLTKTAERNARQRKANRSRFLWLYTRSRRAAVLGVGLIGLTAASWWWAHRLATRPSGSGAVDRALVTAAIPVLGAVLLSDGLGYFDSDLESAASVRWWVVRTLHVSAATAIVGATLAASVLHEPATYGANEMVRNLLGYVGITVGSAVVLGARLAWLPPVLFGSAVFAMVPKPIGELEAWWTWAWQPWATWWAGWTAIALFTFGAAVYIVLGPKRVRDTKDN